MRRKSYGKYITGFAKENNTRKLREEWKYSSGFLSLTACDLELDVILCNPDQAMIWKFNPEYTNSRCLVIYIINLFCTQGGIEYTKENMAEQKHWKQNQKC